MAGPEEIEVTAELVYEDPERALAWLEAAFGFQTRMVVRDDAQRVVFAEIGFGETVVAVGPERPWLRSPRTVGAATQGVRFRILQDVDAHCARARAAGATILREPETFFFGDRSYDAADHEGHAWSFNQRIAEAAGPPPPGWTTRFPKSAG
ncbi:VOC family protein [Caulobacter sp. CCG-8]|uniref:VOC family protein n=1 Tax=Caulobacter sp. CCG-8 TaxID=3127958 RepID=UPI00307CFC62